MSTRAERRAALLNQLPLWLGLVLLWMLLWGSFSWLNLVTGAVLASLVSIVFYLPAVQLSGRLDPARTVVFLLRLCARSRRAGVSCEPGAVYSVHDAGLIRSDRLRAQTESVSALRGQAARMAAAPAAIRSAWRSMVKAAYLDLAYYLAKQGRRGAAVRSLASSFAFHPAAADLRRLVSIVRG